jgi:hypothetical protein
MLRTVAFTGAFSSLLFLSAPAVAQDLAPMALNSLSTAPNVASRPVMDQHGKAIGTAQAVQTDASGKPSAMSLRTADGRIIVLGAAAVSFDGRVLVADSQEPQIAALAQTRTAGN